MKPRLCQWGNCDKEEVAVTINIPAALERPAFCSELHAACYLLAKLGHRALAKELDEHLPRAPRNGDTYPTTEHH